MVRGVPPRFETRRASLRFPSFLAVACGVLSTGAATAAEPWTLSEALGTPENVALEGSYRVRYETLDGPFRAGSAGSDQILVERLLLSARYDFESIYVGAELQDARAQLADAGTPLGTDDVNAVDFLRAYVGFRTSDLFQDGDEVDVTLGRITIDAGSRRLVARNRFRNTINAFSGIQWLWTGAGGTQLNAFLTAPVERRPSDTASLLDNDIELDREDDAVRFWGVHYIKPRLLGAWTGELYVFALREKDRDGQATRDRDLYTPGFRLFRPPDTGAFDYEIEAALQLGDSRLSTSDTDPLLDHFAQFYHAHVAYTADNAWQLRYVLQYDYASGDDDPADADNGRFDTLFGARRFDFGPTGIYGPFVRSNLSSPGVRVEAIPGPALNGFVGYRAVYLASGRDALTAAGLQDPSGESGHFAGHQLETRVRYEIAPDNVELEVGAAWLLKGRFLKTAPDAPDPSDTVYFYAQVAVAF
jgi:hypothetical protein